MGKSLHVENFSDHGKTLLVENLLDYRKIFARVKPVSTQLVCLWVKQFNNFLILRVIISRYLYFSHLKIKLCNKANTNVETIKK